MIDWKTRLSLSKTRNEIEKICWKKGNYFQPNHVNTTHFFLILSYYFFNLYDHLLYCVTGFYVMIKIWKINYFVSAPHRIEDLARVKRMWWPLHHGNELKVPNRRKRGDKFIVRLWVFCKLKKTVFLKDVMVE